MRRVITRIVPVVLAVASLTALIAAGAFDGSAKAANPLKILVGNGSGGIAAQAFLPDRFSVWVGDSVQFFNPYEQVHTVVFTAGGPEPAFMTPVLPGPPPAGAPPPRIILNPASAFPSAATTFDGTAFAGSGVLAKGQSWTLTFTKPGLYTFICNIHPGMQGTVNVSSPPVGLRTTQEEADKAAASMLAAAVSAGEASAAKAKPTTKTNSDGTKTWEVLMPVTAVSSAGQADPMRFVPAKIQIGLGDTVTWVDPNVEPHTVTFTSGAPVPAFVLPEFGPTPGPPTALVANPQVLFPQGGPTYDGTGYRNSGFLGIGLEQHGGTTYSLKFTKAGVYSYVCVIHANQGMAGVVEVGGGLAAPSTGEAGLAEGDAGNASWLLWLAGAGGLAVLAAGAGLTLRHHRA